MNDWKKGTSLKRLWSDPLLTRTNLWVTVHCNVNSGQVMCVSSVGWSRRSNMARCEGDWPPHRLHFPQSTYFRKRLKSKRLKSTSSDCHVRFTDLKYFQRISELWNQSFLQRHTFSALYCTNAALPLTQWHDTDQKSFYDQDDKILLWLLYVVSSHLQKAKDQNQLLGRVTW